MIELGDGFVIDPAANDRLIERLEETPEGTWNRLSLTSEEIGRVIGGLRLAKALAERHQPHRQDPPTKSVLHLPLLCGEDFDGDCSVCVRLVEALRVPGPTEEPTDG